MKSSIIIGLLLFCASQLPAQSLSVFNIDATNFPTMKAKFYAFDSNGVQQSLSTSEITATEDGIPRTVTSITCPPKTTPPPITLGIMVDTYSGIDLAKYGAQRLLNLVSTPPSEAGITMMDKGAFIVQDLTQKTTKLTNGIAKLQSAPGVDLQTMFYAPNAGGVPFVSGRPNKKVLVLITDLHCPLLNLDKAQLFADCARENITVYIILLGTTDMGYAKEITDKTGGLIFENVTTSADLDKVMLNIYPFINNYSPCEITWQSDVSCTTDPRNIRFDWNGIKYNTSYLPPPNAIAQLEFSSAYLYVHSKPIGIKFDTTVTVTAKNAPFSVTNITSTNQLYDINPKSFSLSIGQSKILTVSYTPSDSSYTWTKFDLTTDLCPQSYYASALYGKQKPTVPTIKLIKPNGGEVFLAGSDTAITWTGIPLTDTVKLEYSIDAGSSWNTITDKATGGKYSWHVPDTTSNQCLAKVSQLMQSATDGWAKQAIGKNNSSGSSVAVDDSGNVCITGYFSGTVNFGGITLTSRRNIDIFVAKYHPDGNIMWANRAAGIPWGSGGSPSIAVDHFGKVYVTGYFDTVADFGNITLNGEGVEDIFIAKYDQDGSVAWAKRAGGKQTDDAEGIAVDSSGNIYLNLYYFGSTADFDTIIAHSTRSGVVVTKYRSNGSVEWVKSNDVGSSGGRGGGIAIDASGNVYITGVFQGSANVGGISLSAANGGIVALFVAKYRADGTLEWAQMAGGNNGAYPSGICTDVFGNVYISGHCGNASDFGGITLPSAGKFIAKYHSDGSIEWAKSNIGGNGITTDIYGNVYVTGSSNGYAAKYLPNGILSWTKKGNFNGSGISVDPFDDIFVTGSFGGSSDFGGTTLTSLGNSAAFVWKISDDELQSDVSDSLFSIVAPTFSFASNVIDMGQVEAGREKDSVVKATICNTGVVPLHVLGMDVTGGDKMEFMIMSGAGDFILQPGECRDVMFTFMPMMVGKMSATVTLRTSVGDYPDTIKILGEGIAPLLAVMGDVIDFGQVKIGEFKDTTIQVAIQNIGSLRITFSPASQLGPDMIQFSLLSSAAGFSLSPGASQSVTLRFTPHYVGRTSGRIAFDYNGPSSPAILSVFGQGLGGLVTIPDDSGYAGDHKYIPMILEKVPVASIQSVATNYSARITYDNAVLDPIGGLIQKGIVFDTLNISGSLGSSDTLASLQIRGLLSDRTISPINIVEFNWLDGSGNPADYDADTKSGTFTVLNGCGDSILRSFMITGEVTPSISISPNPSNGVIHIEIRTTEAGRTQVELLNLLGEKVATISDGDLKPGMHTFDFDPRGLAAGSYFMVLTTPSSRKMARVDRQK